MAEEHDKLREKSHRERDRDSKIIKVMKEQNLKLKKLLELKDDKTEKFTAI